MADPQKQAPKPTTMLVDWREPRLLRHVASPKPAKKDSHGRDLPPESRPGFMLRPGINSVDIGAFEVASLTPLFKHYLKTESLVVIESKTGEKVSADDFGDLSEKEAIRVAKATNTEDLLNTWAETEEREPVKAAIADQLDAIAKAAAPVEKKK